MGYSRNKLKPVESHGGKIAKVSLSLVAVGIVVFCVFQTRTEDHRSNEADCSSQTDTTASYPESRPYTGYYRDDCKLGDSSYLSQRSFRESYHIEDDQVKTAYDSNRCSTIYRYRKQDKVVEDDIGYIFTYVADECHDKIVMQQFGNFMYAKNRAGLEKIIEDVRSKKEWLVKNATENNVRVVDSSSNIRYTGNDAQLLDHSLSQALGGVIGTPPTSHEVRIQWKAETCYIEAKFVRLQMESGVWFATIITYSDRMIKEETLKEYSIN